MYTKADRVMDFADDLIRGIRGWTKADHSAYFPIVSPHNANVLALKNGSLLSVIRIDGYMGQYIKDQFNSLAGQWSKFLRLNQRDKSASGFDLFWSYEYDPEGMSEFTKAAKQPVIRAAARRGLDIKDVFEEEAELYGSICAREEQFLFVVTHIDALAKADQKPALAQAAKERLNQPRGASAAPRKVGIGALDVVHAQHVDKVMVFLSQAGFGYSFSRLGVHDAMYAMRHSLTPATTQEGWRAKLTIGDTRMRATEDVPQSVRDNTKSTGKPLDWSTMLPKPLREQMTPEHVVDLGKFVVVGDRTYAPLYVDELASDPENLDKVLRMFYQRKIPVRMVYSLMSNSKQANYWNRLFASIFSFMSASNRQISSGDKAMKAYEENGGAVLGYGLSVVTWTKTEVTYNDEGVARYGVDNIQKRSSDLETLMQQWGSQQLTSIYGCGVEALYSATPGYMIPPANPMAPQVEMDILTQLPLMRPAKLWSPENSMWFRTPDGVLSPYQPMSKRQNAMLTLVLGGMGFGKSNCISEHISYFANHPEASETPYIRGMDFGASSSGVVDMIASSLPENRKHEAIFEYFRNDGTLIKNLLDTRQSCRYPLEDHRNFLINWLLILCDELIERAGGVQSLMAIIGATIDRAYKRMDQREASSSPALYQPNSADKVVKDALDKYEIEIDEHSTYWEVVDALAKVGLDRNDNEAMYASKIAQRRAVPQFQDLILIVSQLESEFRDAPQIDGKPMTSAIANALTNANSIFRCFTGITNTDITESRICVFDMSTVFGRGDGPGAEWKRSVFFATALRLLTEDLFVSKKETGEEMEDKLGVLGLSNEMYQWHISYLERQDQIMKVFWGDELHRIGKVQGAFQIFEGMAYEGRKYRVGLLVGTQMPQHIPEDMRNLASSVFIFGASQSSEIADVMQKIFDLTGDERQIVLDITKPNAEKGAEVFVIHKVDTRVQRLKLHFNIGRIKLWAYATESNERTLRGLLYKKGPSTSWARKILAEKVPDLVKVMSRYKAKFGDDELTELEIVERIANDLLPVNSTMLGQ